MVNSWICDRRIFQPLRAYSVVYYLNLIAKKRIEAEHIASQRLTDRGYGIGLSKQPRLPAS